MTKNELISSLERRIALHYDYLKKNKGGSMCDFYRNCIFEDLGIMYQLDLIDQKEFKRRTAEIYAEDLKA